CAGMREPLATGLFHTPSAMRLPIDQHGLLTATVSSELVVLGDVGVCVVEQVATGRTMVFLQNLADSDSNLTVTLVSVRPAVVADFFDDGVDVSHDPANDDGSVFRRVLVEDLGQRADVRIG